MSFEPGARPSAGGIPLCVPEVRGNEWAYIKECLDSGWVSSVGAYVDRFEAEVARRAGCNYGVATVNGTAALHVALLIAGVEPGDEVLVSALSFIAPANAIRYVGAIPVFIDAEEDYWQMDVAKVREFLRDQCERVGGALRNRRTGRRIAALLPVHILGHPVDIDPLTDAARELGIPVIEDATECLGALYRGRSVGGLGDVSCFSFNGNKILTTGGGGVLATSNEGWSRRAKYLTTQAKDDPVEYRHEEVGYNYRLTNIQAAMGCAQMEQLDAFIARKRALAKRYTEAFSNIPGIKPMRQAAWAESIFWMFTVRIDPGVYGLSSRELLQKLQVTGIQTRPLWQPLHLSGAHSVSSFSKCPVAEQICSEALSLPCSVGLTDAEQDDVISEIYRISAK